MPRATLFIAVILCVLQLCIPSFAFVSVQRQACATPYGAAARPVGTRPPRPLTMALTPVALPVQADGKPREFTMPQYLGDKSVHVRVVEVGSAPMARHWAKALRQKGPEEVALDIESTPTDNPEPDVLSIMADDTVVLFHLARFKSVPNDLVELLKDNDVVKVGCGIRNDLALLHRWYPGATLPADQMRWYDIGIQVARLRGSQQSYGVKSIAQTLYGVSLNKPERLSRSDWGAKRLSSEQVAYAAMDCYVTLRAYWKLWNEDRL